MILSTHTGERAGVRRPRRSALAKFTGCPRLLAGSVALVAVLLLPFPAAADLTLSSVDGRLLREGRILFKNELPIGGIESGAMGGTAMALLQADIETVWLTLLDFPGHAGLFPRVKKSEVIEQGGKRTLVRYLVSVGPFAFRFFVNNYADRASHVLRWKLDHGRENSLFRDHWGYWKLESCQEGVLVTYAMGGRSTLPAFLTRGAGKDGAVQTVKALQQRIERQQSP